MDSGRSDGKSHNSKERLGNTSSSDDADSVKTKKAEKK